MIIDQRTKGYTSKNKIFLQNSHTSITFHLWNYFILIFERKGVKYKMSLIFTLLMGLIVGAVASMIMKSSHGILMDIILGIVGAFVGSVIMNFLGQSGTTGFNIYSFLVSLLGAIVVIWLGRVLTHTTKATY
jgi:uncharacterized membrane protein YeaQ/YmgE (transglycosylase-associated protein family)